MDPLLASIILFAGNFAPRGWAFCNGQILAISQNTALFSLLGTTYGGNGTTTFGLPNLQGRVPMHPGQGTGLSSHTLGEMAGSEAVTLTSAEMPAHNHTVGATAAEGDTRSPNGATLAKEGAGVTAPYSSSTTPDVTLAPASIGVSGGNQPHDNLQPYLCVNYIIALQGVFPSRN